jgi:hypothetical protein
MWPFSRSFRPVTEIPDGWAVTSAEHDGQPLFLRINSGAWKLRGHPDYAWRLGIAAPIPPETPLPSVNEPESPFRQLEERAEEILRTGCESLPVLVLTAPTFRELVYYTRDVAAARHKADAICREFRTIRAASVAEEDPDWSCYIRFCGGRKP